MLQIAFVTSFVDFSFICFAFYIDILIDYFFHITCVFHCTVIDIFDIITNTICDETNFRLVIINIICISITFVMTSSLPFVISF